MRFLFSNRILRVALALAVVLWTAGAACMFGCGNMMTAAAANEFTSSSTIVAEGSACAAMHSRDNCPKHRADAAAKNASQTNAASMTALALTAIPGTMMNCPLAANAAVASSKATPDHTYASLSSFNEKSFLIISPEQPGAFAPPLRLPNRGHTYLRGCVFLI